MTSNPGSPPPSDRRTTITLPTSLFPWVLLLGGLTGGTALTTVGGTLTRSGDVKEAVETVVKVANAEDNVRIQVLEIKLSGLEQQNAEIKASLKRLEEKIDDLRSRQ